ncbi:1-(5-phosphoribosyl)-5-[(5-phosphoribosylamino)methylideneamino] imidazole-4-carboxamide isomerase [Pseudooceanicola batsensis HTCC2597]|uniref:1-(5-phosphoribosyl)-5-[(5-phosphoribosylamino)methylideneamino] imidazole-4-carboxamide isomerase n=1 Tax=Pseudooceanicola batsensis (strain ATCC BAA-863 / DSM 15984 / KCTC 12145 / HTCC2597) TaxID=252305 RepID=A3TX40_PSEBH|nr:hypothetical protein [Pseudooceanicola batsensis]EAQ03400.1 1-(5-phosphoribosyl)-5-[(5-phosphoribosylamino)methylideneamino] imidazole-4-carboxamide isomerase [Pseudooceanicola batsensis HTCC2597]
MTDLLLPLALSLVVTGAGRVCRFRGSRYLLTGMGGLTALAILVVLVMQVVAGMLGCAGGSFRDMICATPTPATERAMALGRFAVLLTLPGLVAGPVAVPLAGLAEYLTRRRARRV